MSHSRDILFSLCLIIDGFMRRVPTNSVYLRKCLSQTKTFSDLKSHKRSFNELKYASSV